MVITMNGIPLTNPLNPVKESIRDWSRHQATEAILGALDAVRDVLVDLSYTIALVGSGLCLLFWVAGWRDGKRWTGMLCLGYVIIKLLLG
ncbi:hypothetical protein [Paenibacillus sp. Marseille-Q4541]|uniref:hypothetical protein n=1 Tax=Paenibacillus sp. Marseille-Q4541 TaxID=2831522 RepID=UPI001BACEF9B|nr:hypothetical protein [Paenibacillus sp. Marseille-Q4541]